MVQEADLVRLRRPRYVADIPDALYMVEEKPRAMGTAGVDVLAAAFPGITIFYYCAIIMFRKFEADIKTWLLLYPISTRKFNRLLPGKTRKIGEAFFLP